MKFGHYGVVLQGMKWHFSPLNVTFFLPSTSLYLSERKSEA